MMTLTEQWSTLAGMAGIEPAPHGGRKKGNGKPIYFDSINDSACVLGKARDSVRRSRSLRMLE